MLGLVERIFFEIRHIMDPLTQGLLGACVCGGLFSKQLGRWSWAVGLVAGLLADADMLVNLWMTPLDALYFHRHFTHTLWFIPIGGLIACLPFLFVPKMRLRRKSLMMGAIAAYASHAPLDMLTSYGTPFFWPLDYTRISLDILPIVDPIFTLILLVGVIVLTIKRSNAIGRLTLMLLGMYIAFAATQHNRATNAQIALIENRSQKAEIARVMPTLGNVLVWQSVYKTGGAIQTDILRVPLTSDPVMVVEGKSHALLKKERVFKKRKITADNQIAKDIEEFEWFAGGLVAPVDNRQQNHLADWRYTIDDTPLWYLKVEFKNPDKRGVLVHNEIDRKAALKKLWELIKAPPAHAKSIVKYYPVIEE